jgi:hypothetical protein
MMNALMRISFVFAFLLNDVAAQPRPIEGVEILEMVDFKAGIDAGQCEWWGVGSYLHRGLREPIQR